MTTSPIDLIREGREQLACEDRSAWSATALSDHMLAVTEEHERLGAELVRLTAEWNAAGAWGVDGFVSPTAWLSALAGGRVTTAKLDLLAEAARGREKYHERHEEMLLDVAARLDVRDLPVALRTWRLLADDEQAAHDANDALDLIEPPDPTNGADLPRTLSQRRGEALVKLAQHYLDRRADPDTPGRAVPSVTVLFTPELDQWMLEDHHCEIDGFGAVCFDTVSRLLCDARGAWMRMNERREVLDMGREARTPTTAQRRAVIARDRHCRYPNCRAPARWCDVHHLVDWDHGGPTDLVNLVLLCRRHHVAVHEGGRHLVRLTDGSIAVTPGFRHRNTRARRERLAQWARGDPDG